MNLLKSVALDLYGNMKSYLKEGIIVTIIICLLIFKLNVSTGAGGVSIVNKINYFVMRLLPNMFLPVLLLIIFLVVEWYLFKRNRGNNTKEIADKKIMRDTGMKVAISTFIIYLVITGINLFSGSSIKDDWIINNIVAFVTINITLLLIQYGLINNKYEVSESQTTIPEYMVLKFSVKKNTIFIHATLIIVGYWIGANIFEGIDDTQVSTVLFEIASATILVYIILFLKNCVIGFKMFRKKEKVKKDVTKLNLKNINISANLFNELSLFNLIRYPNQDLPVMSFLLDLDDFFPNDAEERIMYFEGYAKPYKKGVSEFKFLTDNQVILLFDYNYDYKINTYNLKVRISYKVDEKYIGKFINLVIGLESREGIVLPVQKYVYDYKEYANKKPIDFSFMTNAKKAEESNHNLVRLKALSNVFWYSADTLDSDVEIIKQETTDKRKVVVHGDNLGIGKTTYDIIKTTNHGMIPIVVSAWQSNYDHDILYLIFDTIRRQTNTKLFGKDNSLFCMVFFAGCLGVLKTLKDLMFPGLAVDLTNYVQVVVAIICLISFIIITKLIWHTISYKFLILKKDNTKVYKDFYIDEIISMLRINSNYILVIEDVDRLKPEVINEVFRILSLINYRLPLDFRRFAIISYSEETVKSKLSDINVSYNDVYNKIASPLEWAAGYKPHSSMILNSKQNICNVIDVMKDVMYVESQTKANGCCCCRNCSSIWGIDQSQLKAIEEKILNPDNKLNFRNIVSVCEKMNKEIHDSILSGLVEQKRQKFKYNEAKSIYKLFNDKLDQEIIVARSQQNNRESGEAL